MKKIASAVALCAAFLMSSSVIAFAAPETSGVEQFSTTTELKQASGLKGTVRTVGHASVADRAGMVYSVEPTRPTGSRGALAIPLSGGKWAVPKQLRSQPRTQVDAASVEDEMTRARTFVKAGRNLIWDSTRATPLSGKVIHETNSKPYALTCSSFVGMVLQGWDYQNTTYVAKENKRVGDWVDFGQPSHKADLWQAYKLARWLYANGDMWLDGGAGTYQRGDVLFFSKSNPEGKASGTYFGNIYHVAIYAGDGKIIHSYGVMSGAGVVEEKLSDYLKGNLTFVARPQWKTARKVSNAAPPSESSANAAKSAAAVAPAATATPGVSTQPSGPGAENASEGSATSSTTGKTPSTSPAPRHGTGGALPRTGAGVVATITGAFLLVGGFLLAFVKRRRREE